MGSLHNHHGVNGSGPQRVLITGCGGMLGNAIYPYFHSQCPYVFASDKVPSLPWLHELDVCNRAALREAVAETRPDLILHLAAETDLEYCESHPDIARATNAEATRSVAELAEEAGCTLVYISTAGVFDGVKDGYYTEADPANPINVYGQTKFDGEEHVRRICRKHYVVRAGWMVGGGPGKDHKFVSLMVGQIEEGRKVLHAVEDKLGTPTYTHDFAKTLFRLLASQHYGTYHMVCEGSGSRYDVACEIVNIFGKSDVEVKPVSSDFFKDRYFVARPRSEMMLNTNLTRLGLNTMRPWREALRDYLEGAYSSVRASQPHATHQGMHRRPSGVIQPSGGGAS